MRGSAKDPFRILDNTAIIDNSPSLVFDPHLTSANLCVVSSVNETIVSTRCLQAGVFEVAMQGRWSVYVPTVF